MNFSDQK